MIYLFGIAIALSLLLIGAGFLMDRSAIMSKINGANGLPLLVAVVVSFVGSLLLAIGCWIFDDLVTAAEVLLFSFPYHAVIGGLSVWRLQSLATKVASKKN